MRLSNDAIEFLVRVVTGDSGQTTYRSGPNLVDFFNMHGEVDLYGQDFPSRHTYVREKINKMQGEERLKAVVEAAFDSSPGNADEERAAEDLAFQFSRITARDGYKLKKCFYPGFYEGSSYHPGPMYFDVVRNVTTPPAPPGFLLEQDNLNEHVSKARHRIETGDNSGAIAICYTLIEEFLKIALSKNEVEYNENEGDIKKLYRTLAKETGIAPHESTPAALKPILNGLTTMVGGFYEIANKASDRHAQKFKPSAHHARLVVSLTFSFCEFLIDSDKYRKHSKK